MDAEALKACCADLYSGDWARLLLGDSFHPGGLELTTRLGSLLGLHEGSRVLDVAAGRGASALHLARSFGCQVVGVDYSARNVELASSAAGEVRLDGLVRFLQADAERLGLPDASFDAIVCECSYCTFPDKERAAHEFARVLRPGGRAGLSDLVRNGPLPSELNGLLAHVACIGDARPLAEYRRDLEGSGLVVEHVEDQSRALEQLVEGIRSRLLGADLLARLQQIDLGVDLGEAKQLARAALHAIRGGTLGYGLLVATKPDVGVEGR